MDETINPTLRHWQLAELMRRRREDLGLTQDQAAGKLREHGPKWSKSKLNRVETRQYIPKPPEITEIARAYLIDPDDEALMIQMSREARTKGWWQNTPVQHRFHTMIGLEQAATVIRWFELALVPGLLQTPEYATALVEAIEPTTPIETMQGFVGARMTRQHLIKATSRLKYHAIIWEPALQTPVGSARIMRNQLERLLELAEQPNLSIQVLPLAAGATPGLEGAFCVLTIPELANDVAFVEGQAGMVYLESQDDVRRCTMRFGVLAAMAFTPSSSIELITTTLTRYR